MPVDIALIADSAPAEPAYSAEVPPASEMAGSDAIVNLQSETPAARLSRLQLNYHRQPQLSVEKTLLIMCRLTLTRFAPVAPAALTSDAIVNLQSETPAVVEATPALATDFTAQVHRHERLWLLLRLRRRQQVSVTSASLATSQAVAGAAPQTLTTPASSFNTESREPVTASVPIAQDSKIAKVNLVSRLETLTARQVESANTSSRCSAGECSADEQAGKSDCKARKVRASQFLFLLILLL